MEAPTGGMEDPRGTDLPDCLGQLFFRLRGDMQQAYQDALSYYAAERRRLADEVALLRAELRGVPGGASVDAGFEEGPCLGCDVVQPPAAARVAPFLVRVHEVSEAGPAGIEVERLEALLVPEAPEREVSPGRFFSAGVEFYTAEDDGEDTPDGTPTESAHDSTDDGERVRGRRNSSMTTSLSLKEVHAEESMVAAQRRLQTRLAHLRGKGVIAGRDLHQTLCAFGLERYSVKEMDALIHHLGVAINVRVREVGRPEWRWPDAAELDANGGKSTFRIGRMARGGVHVHEEADYSDKVLPFKALMELFFKDETYLEKLLGPMSMDLVFAVREVLLTGEANRIISELTCVRIDDLATRRQRVAHVFLLDPVVGLMILLNGIAIGLSMEAPFDTWDGWLWVEVFFSSFFALEILARQSLEGCRAYFMGPERHWNLCDIVLVGVGALSSIFEMLDLHSAGSSLSVLRFLRAVRFARLVRIFRLGFMLELRLMVKGVCSGMRTLFWACVLLSFVLYALGVVTASLFRDAEDEVVHEMFGSVPHAMFTTFECVTGICMGNDGIPLTWRLFHIYGVKFGISFAAMYILITLGLFNVILAIYVEVTMVAAKQTEDATKGHYQRERIRMAQITKKLLKMFCGAYHYYNRLTPSGRQFVDLHDALISAELQDLDLDHEISISKELFLLVVQDPEVKKLMDDLDIPPDRVNLFDSIDADGSGSLQATELVRGFLKVRGEAKKMDQAACVLILRSVQGTLRRLEDAMEEQRRSLAYVRGTQRTAERGRAGEPSGEALKRRGSGLDAVKA